MRGVREPSTSPWFDWTVVIVLWVFGFSLIYFVISKALSHEWYPIDCCSGRDCSSIPSYRVDRVSGGYLIDGIHFVAERDARNSPDGQFHACFPVNAKSWLRCFFRPPMSM